MYRVLSLDILEFSLNNLLQTVRNVYIRDNYRNIYVINIYPLSMMHEHICIKNPYWSFTVSLNTL